MVRLRKLIEETYEINGDMPVNVICHRYSKDRKLKNLKAKL